MDNSAMKDAARKELLRRAARKELERRKSSSWAETGMDALKGAGAGLAKGVMSLGGALGDVQQMTGDVASWGAERFGASPETQEMASNVARRIATPTIGQMPRTEQIRGVVEGVTGPMYEARTMPGQILDRAGQIAPAALAGPGSLVRKAAMVAAPAVAGELATRIPGVEGSSIEPYIDTGASLAAGFGAATLGGKKNVISKLRDDAMVKSRDVDGNVTSRFNNTDQLHSDVSNRTKAAYSATEDARIVFDGADYKSAATKITEGLKRMEFNPSSDTEVAQIYRRVKGLAGAGGTASWAKTDDLLKDAKAILRSNADSTTKKQIGIIVSALEDLVKTDKLRSLKGIPRDQIKPMIDDARDLGRRKALADQINEMKRKMPGYLSGDESASRNQFGSYLRNSKAGSLSDAEKAAFGKVVRREGPLNVAHMAGSRIGMAMGSGAGGLIGTGIGALIGGIPGALIGAGSGAALNAASSSAFRKALDKLTEKAVDDALVTVLAGRKAQGIATSASSKAKLQASIRAALAAETASRPIREDWIVQDARGNKYGP